MPNSILNILFIHNTMRPSPIPAGAFPGKMTSPGGATYATLTTPLKSEQNKNEERNIQNWTNKRKIKDNFADWVDIV